MSEQDKNVKLSDNERLKEKVIFYVAQLSKI